MSESKEPQKYELLPPPDTLVWRYLSLAKLLALFRARALFLSRVDLLEDPFEGAFSKGSIQDHESDWGLGSSENVVALTRWAPCRSFVNCWHESNVESVALWKIYAGSEGALAIQSTLGALQSIFPEFTTANGDLLVNQAVRRVQYIDYRTEHPYLNDLMGPLCYKRRAFAYEQEIRVIRQEFPTGPANNRPGGRAIKMGPPPEHQGIEIPIDLTKLIEAVHLAPASPAWMLDVVAESMSRFELGPIPCRQSALDQLPDFGRYGI